MTADTKNKKNAESVDMKRKKRAMSKPKLDARKVADRKRQEMMLEAYRQQIASPNTTVVSMKKRRIKPMKKGTPLYTPEQVAAIKTELEHKASAERARATAGWHDTTTGPDWRSCGYETRY